MRFKIKKNLESQNYLKPKHNQSLKHGDNGEINKKKLIDWDQWKKASLDHAAVRLVKKEPKYSP